MQIDPQSVWSDIQTIKKFSPLVHNITNYVVMELTANSLLAIGASPVMAHAIEEAEDMAMIANSLVLNIGTLSPFWTAGMLLALKAANSKDIPMVKMLTILLLVPYFSQKQSLFIISLGDLMA